MSVEFFGLKNRSKEIRQLKIDRRAAGRILGLIIMDDFEAGIKGSDSNYTVEITRKYFDEIDARLNLLEKSIIRPL